MSDQSGVKAKHFKVVDVTRNGETYSEIVETSVSTRWTYVKSLEYDALAERVKQLETDLEISKVRSQIDSLRDIAKPILENDKVWLSKIEEKESEILRLRSCCKDFQFVLEGSVAEKGQTEALLDERENALIRALEWDRPTKPILGG